MGKTTAYRGYSITETMDGFYIEKDGFFIGWAKTLERARTMIDGLLDPEQPESHFEKKLRSIDGKGKNFCQTKAFGCDTIYYADMFGV